MRKIVTLPNGQDIEMPGNTPDNFKIGRPNLIISPEAENKIEVGDWIRAAGDLHCCGCGLPYNRHPNLRGYEWATVLCDNAVVKL